MSISSELLPVIVILYPQKIKYTTLNDVLLAYVDYWTKTLLEVVRFNTETSDLIDR